MPCRDRGTARACRPRRGWTATTAGSWCRRWPRPRPPTTLDRRLGERLGLVGELLGVLVGVARRHPPAGTLAPMGKPVRARCGSRTDDVGVEAPPGGAGHHGDLAVVARDGGLAGRGARAGVLGRDGGVELGLVEAGDDARPAVTHRAEEPRAHPSGYGALRPGGQRRARGVPNGSTPRSMSSASSEKLDLRGAGPCSWWPPAACSSS